MRLCCTPRNMVSINYEAQLLFFMRQNLCQLSSFMFIVQWFLKCNKCAKYSTVMCLYFVFSADLTTISVIQTFTQLLVCLKALLFLCILFLFIHTNCLFICLVDYHSFTYWLLVIYLLSAVTSCSSLPLSLMCSSVDFFALILHTWQICHSLCDSFQDAAITQNSTLGQRTVVRLLSRLCRMCAIEC